MLGRGDGSPRLCSNPVAAGKDVPRSAFRTAAAEKDQLAFGAFSSPVQAAVTIFILICCCTPREFVSACSVHTRGENWRSLLFSLGLGARLHP